MILQALCEYYQRLANDPDSDVSQEGYAPAKVTTCIVLNDLGDIARIIDLRIPNGKKLEPMVLNSVPLQPKRAGQKPEAAFLCENINFLFGFDDKGKIDAAKYRFEASLEKHKSILSGLPDQGAQALLLFFSKRKLGSYLYEGVDTSLLDECRKNKGNIVFRLDNDVVFLHQRQAVRTAWESSNTKKDLEALRGQCLITGTEGPIARLHGNLNGFGQDKPTVVGFNQDSFTSYHKDQGANAPVSTLAAFQYVTALQKLLIDRHHSTNLHGDRLLFWAERDAPNEEALVQYGLSPDNSYATTERVGDESTALHIHSMFDSLLSGKAIRELDLDPDITFYILGCTTNKTRLVIRFFHRSSFGTIIDLIRQHYADIGITGLTVYPSLYKLLRETAVQGKSENVPAPLRIALLRSIFDGGRYPVSLYTSILQRIRVEAAADARRAINPLRIGLLKGYLNRLSRIDRRGGEILVALNTEETNEGYLLGRVFALLERAQYDALGGQLNSTIVDKYLNAALATPQNVFPTLLCLAEKHFSKSKKYYIKTIIGNILAQMTSQGFPNTLNAEDQGRFMIGYYHQKYSYRSKDGATNEDPEDEIDNDDQNEGGN